METVTEWRKSFRSYLEKRRLSPPGSVDSYKTHCMEIMRMIREGLGDLAETQKAHYLGNGMSFEFRFADGKDYRITIQEIKK